MNNQTTADPPLMLNSWLQIPWAESIFLGFVQTKPIWMLERELVTHRAILLSSIARGFRFVFFLFLALLFIFKGFRQKMTSCLIEPLLMKINERESENLLLY